MTTTEIILVVSFLAMTACWLYESRRVDKAIRRIALQEEHAQTRREKILELQDLLLERNKVIWEAANVKSAALHEQSDSHKLTREANSAMSKRLLQYGALRVDLRKASAMLAEIVDTLG